MDAANRLGQRTIVGSKLDAHPYVIHAEECAFSQFEFDVHNWPGKADGVYPPGSVVGSWHMGTFSNLETGKQLSTCSPNVPGSDENQLKNNRACEVVTRDLQISARVRGLVTIRPETPAPNCARGLAHRNTANGPACSLPIRPSSKGPSKEASTFVTSSRMHIDSTVQKVTDNHSKTLPSDNNPQRTKSTKASLSHVESLKTKITAATKTTVPAVYQTLHTTRKPTSILQTFVRGTQTKGIQSKPRVP